MVNLLNPSHLFSTLILNFTDSYTNFTITTILESYPHHHHLQLWNCHNFQNTPGTRVSPGFCNRTVAVKSRKKVRGKKREEKKYYFLDIPSNYAKIWGGTASGVSPIVDET